MSKINIAFVHGIGKNGPGFSKDLARGITREFNSALRKVLKTAEDYSADLNFIEVVWDDILAPNQAKLTDIFQKEFKRRGRKEKVNYFLCALTFLGVIGVFSFIFKNPFIMTLLVFGGFFALKFAMIEMRTAIAAEFINDIISYREQSTQKLILQRVEEFLEPLAKVGVAQKVSFISHSLGTVIASDYAWEAQKADKFFDQKMKMGNFFTMGSPLPLFSLQFGGPEMFTRPIKIQDEAARWVNIYDNDDPIAYPLKCLNDAYNQTVWTDKEVNVGWFGIAHVNYWKNNKVACVMAHKFALDWLRENEILFLDEIQKLAKKYDRELSIF